VHIDLCQWLLKLCLHKMVINSTFACCSVWRFFFLWIFVMLHSWKHWFFLSRLGIGEHHFYLWKLGLVASWYFWCEVCSTFDLLPLLTMALPCIWFLSCLGSALEGTTFIFGTLVLYMTSFHCRLWLFLALLSCLVLLS
jgi:hypothetical protein